MAEQNPYIELETVYEQAPARIKEIFESKRFHTFISSVTETLHLDSDREERVTTETLMLLLGITPIGTILESLEKYANLTEEQAVTVVDEMEKQVFAPVRTSTTLSQKEVSPLKPQARGQAIQSTEIVPRPEQLEASAPRPLAVVPHIEIPQAPKPAPPPAPPVETLVAPAQARTMASDIEALEHPAAPHPTVQAVAQVMPTATPTPKERTPTVDEIEETLKKYGIDPYREPVE